jgi:hypothetical protein
LFSHDSDLAHRALATHKKLACLGFHCLDHPPYFLDLALSEYHLIPGLKKFKSCYFTSNAAVITATDTWLGGQPSEFFVSGLQKLEQQAKKFIEVHGEYTE